MRVMKRLFHRMFWFNLWQKLDMVMFVLFHFNRNGPKSLYDMLYHKLTSWGLYLAYSRKHYSTHEEYRRYMHEIWTARQYVKWIQEDRAEKQADETVRNIFKTKYEIDMPSYEFKVKDHKLEVYFKLPRGYNKEQRKEIKEFMRQLVLQRGQMENSLHTAYVYKVYDILRQNADMWW